MNIEQSFSRFIAHQAAKFIDENLEGEVVKAIRNGVMDPKKMERVRAVLGVTAAHNIAAVSIPPVVVRPSKSLLQRIDLSDIEDIAVKDIPRPFKAFVVDLRKIDLRLPMMPEAHCRVGVVSDVITDMDGNPYPHLILTIFLRSDITPEDEWGVFTHHIPGDFSVNKLGYFLEKDAQAKLVDHDVEFYRDTSHLILKRALGVSLYMTTDNAQLTIRNKPMKKKGDVLVLPPIRSKHKLRKRHQEKEELKHRRISAGASLQPIKAHANTIVRGHFRQQAHGPGRKLRKTIWIQPHVRFKDDSFPTLGRDIEGG